MKLLMIFIIVLLFGCEKDKTRCWTCETAKVSYKLYNTTGVKEHLWDDYDVEAVCDFDEEGIRLYEIANSDTTEMGLGSSSYVQIIEAVTKCK